MSVLETTVVVSISSRINIFLLSIPTSYELGIASEQSSAGQPASQQPNRAGPTIIAEFNRSIHNIAIVIAIAIVIVFFRYPVRQGLWKEVGARVASSYDVLEGGSRKTD
ncbi:uncharacterized protein EURHEDRAFT_407906 [Aspergillus ruber CBS 135680]|uniref:Uncharacterized protein n=1 Tax=Aspergillus ruber (strain CBS 135680) TaxID=1388766 RepID=A0A017SSD3_ASPRC|nr:uncharacterized protein EURHEDRAFT_407906 [Aspergillus ruber CBS 135680]EYE99897.1 hypothetical protein EURHEDRAFT_407906 [Aspergillus ruber CBS 135680]